MPFILGLLAILAGAYFWANRARNAGMIAQDLAGMAGDVVNAARAFGFRRRANIHPVESVDDPVVAIAGMGVAFMEMGSLPSAEQHKALVESLQHNFSQGQKQSEEAVILGRWLMTECGTAQAGFERMAKRVHKLDGAARFEPMMAVLKDIAASGPGLSTRQGEALQDIKNIFRLR